MPRNFNLFLFPSGEGLKGPGWPVLLGQWTLSQETDACKRRETRINRMVQLDHARTWLFLIASSKILAAVTLRLWSSGLFSKYSPPINRQSSSYISPDIQPITLRLRSCSDLVQIISVLQRSMQIRTQSCRSHLYEQYPEPTPSAMIKAKHKLLW